MHENLIPIVSIVGPTASGKTKLAVDLALAFGGEIISADSMQIYKEFNISTAKPTVEEQSLVKHHLIDIINVDEEFNVAEFIKLAKCCAKDIFSRNRLPFLVGGTGLYVDSFLKNIQFEKFSNVSAENHSELENKSNEELFEILKKIDPKSATEIHINNKKRIIRAIEFFYASGYPISVQTESSKNAVSPYKVCKIGINFKNRNALYEKINLRVEKMFENGLVDEIKSLLNTKLSKTARGAIGYKEILEYFSGKISLEEAKENLKQATRRYAKRQITWFKRDPEINWVYIDEFKNYSEVLERSKEIIENYKLKDYL